MSLILPFLCQRSNAAADTTFGFARGPQCSLCSAQTSYQRFREDAVPQHTYSVHEENHLSRLSVYSNCVCILIVYQQWWRENVRALRDLGERIWLHLCPIKQLAGSRGRPNIFLYLVSSLHLSAYGFMTSKLFGGEKRHLSTEPVTND